MSWFTPGRLGAIVISIFLGVVALFFERVLLPLLEPVVYAWMDRNGVLSPPAPITPAAPAAPVGLGSPMAAAPAAATSFQVNFLYRSGGAGALRPILPGSVLHSGDTYKVVFTPPRDGYVYLFQVDSAGSFFQLFPMGEFQGVRLDNRNPVQGGRRYTLPADDKSFRLDATLGRERILLAFTDVRHQELEALAGSLANARAANDPKAQHRANEALGQQLSASFQSRGLASVETDQPLRITWGRDGQVFDTLGRQLESLCDDCVYSMEFAHQAPYSPDGKAAR